jgi:heterodisulfide reductase subunit A
MRETAMAAHENAPYDRMQWDETVTLESESRDVPSQRLKKVERSACQVACPAGVNVKGYLGLIAAGKFAKALALVKETNPLPGICGRVCTHPCESECERGNVDEPVAICALKRFIADYELAHPEDRPRVKIARRKENIAIIGSGPAGLTAAHDLARRGYRVTIFESLPLAGGMLAVGIPSYRLPRDIIQTEIRAIEDLGVTIKLNTTFGRDITFEELKEEGYEAVFLAIGAHQGLKLGIPGEDEFSGFLDCITFLRNMNLGDMTKPGRKVIVIGGGNSAIDSARSALRLGAEEVHIVYRRSRKEMPANEAEIIDAEDEGVKIDYLATPVKIIGDAGKVTGMECIRMKLGEPDSSGRRRPIPIEGTEFTIEADVIIPAISQRPDLTFLPDEHDLEISRWNSFAVDEATLATNREGIFAGGDAVSGPLTVIDAIAAGHKAATSIHRYIQGIVPKESNAVKSRGRGIREVEIPRQKIETESKKHPGKIAPSKRRRSFDEVESSFTEAIAREEAARCLRCGECVECRECIENCEKRLMFLTEKGEETEVITSRTPLKLLRIHRDSPLYSYSNQPLSDFYIMENAKGTESKRHDVSLSPIYPAVREKFCRGCGDCKEACEYSAIILEDNGKGARIAHVNEELCRGCGVCVSVCPSGAMDGEFLSDERINSALTRSLRQE